MTPAHCEYQLWRNGGVHICRRTVGVRRWWDAAGFRHAACASHIAERLHRCPEADPPEPAWDLPEAAACPFCLHPEHLADVCENDMGEFGECPCADYRSEMAREAAAKWDEYRNAVARRHGDLPEAADPVTVAKWWAERESWTGA